MTKHLPPLRLQFGLHLIELLIVLALVGILLSVALPSYQQHIAKSERAEIKVQLLILAQQQQQYFTRHLQYNSEQKLPDNMTYEFQLNVDKTNLLSFILVAEKRQNTSLSACARLTVSHLGQQLPEDCW